MHYSSGSQPGVRVPLGVREKLTGGTPNFEKHSKQVHLGTIFDFGGTQRGYNFDLGVHRGVQSLLGVPRVPKGWEPLHYSLKLELEKLKLWNIFNVTKIFGYVRLG